MPRVPPATPGECASARTTASTSPPASTSICPRRSPPPSPAYSPCVEGASAMCRRHPLTLGAPFLLPSTTRPRSMGAIDTEDAARRLARVILSDIDLYIRERPKLGESREAQIEEGRRLFASRVTPALVPVYAMVLADRAAGRVNAPVAAPASALAAAHAPADSDAEFEDAPATDPAIFVPFAEDQTPAVAARL